MTKANQPDTTGSALKDLLRRMKIVETAPQLTKASIKDGALRVLDAAFGMRVKLGRLDGDFDGDGDPDWGLAIFDAAGDLVLLGTKAGLFVKGIITASIITGSTITGGTISGGTITGASIQTDTPPNPRVLVTDAAPAPYEAAVQFFQGSEPVGAQGFIAQYLDPFTLREILGLGPSGLAGSGLGNRAAMFLVSRKADGTGDREIILYAGEKLYSDAARTQLAGHLNIGTPTRGVHSLRAGLALVGGPVDPSIDQVYEQTGYWDVTTNAAGDGILTWPETFPNGLLSVVVNVLGANNYTSWVEWGLHDNPTTSNIGIRFFDGATGVALGAGVGFRLSYTVKGW